MNITVSIFSTLYMNLNILARLFDHLVIVVVQAVLLLVAAVVKVVKAWPCPVSEAPNTIVNKTTKNRSQNHVHNSCTHKNSNFLSLCTLLLLLLLLYTLRIIYVCIYIYSLASLY